jgi:hypothetical protein
LLFVLFVLFVLSRANVMVDGKRVPRLPKQQLTILAICRFAEPVAMTSVYPYIVRLYRRP